MHADGLLNDHWLLSRLARFPVDKPGNDCSVQAKEYCDPILETERRQTLSTRCLLTCWNVRRRAKVTH
jgi:hypothetical protein